MTNHTAVVEPWLSLGPVARRSAVHVEHAHDAIAVELRLQLRGFAENILIGSGTLPTPQSARSLHYTIQEEGFYQTPSGWGRPMDVFSGRSYDL
ncbi:hypothetical protein LCGC14_0921590 [marine sediment metagenome]|uniref:Uncharacterized protein n=1 Tax=marine sediment metagenome TaxID=412755 RepID=A0A0F9PBC0_9ZZZZ